MGLNLDDKKAVVAEVSAQVANAQTIAVAEYRGIAVGDLTVLRAKARESGVYLRVLKNTLVRRAIADTPFAGLADQLVGPLIYSVSEDPVAAAKVLNEFAKGNPKLVVLDEPNSNLDSQGEAALAKALEHARKQKITVVTITQRPALLNVVDKILVLNNGSVSMFGTRSEVMAALTGKSGNDPTAINATRPRGEN